MRKVIIFTECSQTFGMGHLMRSQIWQSKILEYGKKNNLPLECELCVFDGEDGTKAWFYGDNFKDFQGDLAIIDSYQAELGIYKLALELFKKVAVMDDLARLDFPKECHIINGALDSARLYPDYPHIHAGPEYQALHEAFYPPKKARQNDILLAFGGSDVNNFTQAVFDSIAPFAQKHHHQIHVILGKYYPHSFQAREFAEITKTHSNGTQEEIAKLFRQTSLFVLSGGVILNEALATHGNILALITASNQSHQVKAYAEAKIILQGKLPTLKKDFQKLIYRQKIKNPVLEFGTGIPKVLNQLL